MMLEKIKSSCLEFPSWIAFALHVASPGTEEVTGAFHDGVYPVGSCTSCRTSQGRRSVALLRQAA